jgi:pyruvate,orthophosphate dikinase
MAKALKSNKYVYTWGNKKADGDGSMKPLLGGKGANLAEMTRIGLPVPPGFTITTEVCTYFYAHKKTYPEGTAGADGSGHREHGKDHGHKFGDAKAMPLLVAVRSGARDSMPGMMDTILNLGLNDQTVVCARRRDEERALRVGLLPPFHPDVWRRGHRRAEARERRPRTV